MTKKTKKESATSNREKGISDKTVFSGEVKDTAPVAKPDKAIAIALYIIWFLIAGFGIYSMTEPEWIAEASRENKKNEIGLIVNEGVALSMEGKNEEAIKKFREALDIMPDFTEAGVNLANAYSRIGKYDEAAAILNDALKSSPPAVSNIYDNLVDIYTYKKDEAKMKENFILAMKTNPFILERLMKEGVYYFNKQDWKKAHACFDSALQKRKVMKTYYRDMFNTALIRYYDDKEKTTVINNLIGKEITESMMNRYDSALFYKILYRDKGFAENYNKAGYCYAKMEKYEEALPCFHEAVKIWPEYKDAYNNIQYIKKILANAKNKED